MEQTCLFSIIVACHNEERYIETAINSIINQTFNNWELIIVDDGSTDNSVGIIQRYVNKIPNKIKLIKHNQNLGLCASRRTAIDNINSNIFGILDADDALLPEAIETMYKSHLDYPECGLIYSQFIYCDEKLATIRTGYCREIPKNKTNLEVNVISHFRTHKLKYYKLTSGFHQTLDLAEDKDMAFKMEEVAPVKFIDKVLYLYRQHSEGISQQKNRTKAKECMLIVQKEARERRTKGEM